MTGGRPLSSWRFLSLPLRRKRRIAARFFLEPDRLADAEWHGLHSRARYAAAHRQRSGPSYISNGIAVRTGQQPTYRIAI
jgi:hypothetical protein